VDVEQLAGIGIGVPGALNLEKGVLIDSPNLGWHDLAISRELKKRFGVKTTVLNDVDAGVYGEYARGAAQNARCVLGVFPGTGIGGGCVYDGGLITGGERSCLEIGHLPTVLNGARCGCGRRGCLETVASRLAISSQAAVAAYRGEAPNLLEAAGCDISNIRSGVLAKAIEAGDEIIERIIRDAAAWLGFGIASAVNLLAPDVVLLGGGLTEAMPDLYREEVGAALERHIMPAYEGTYRIEIAQLGDDAVATGAAGWARRRKEEKE
ncbi:MAG: ROK family protein, partial [Chitinivibrionales bacterium]|nr:ROK family protein [Chitinivibrionales bacterium]